MFSFRCKAYKLVNEIQFHRKASTGVPKNEISPILTNRNPRNLEKLRIGYKPDGYHIDNPGKCYWHKLELTETSKYVTAEIKHFENGVVLKASTSEWPIRKQLYKTKDTSAYINLGRILAERCLQCGLIEISCFQKPKNPDGKLANFLKALEEGGINLSEPSQYKPSRPWDLDRAEKPWEVTE